MDPKTCLRATLEDCKIVWLCPLTIELRAAIAMLDEVLDFTPPKVRGQSVVYTLGRIGAHKVAVVGYYQEHGLSASGSMAAEVLRDLPNLELGLLVGIAGGIPSPTQDIQLGDVAVAVPDGGSPGVVGYDRGKHRDNDSFEVTHSLQATHPLLRSVIGILRARQGYEFRRHLHILESRPEFQKPSSSDNNGQLVLEPPSDSTHPSVHYGTILSGNAVIKSKAKRDALRARYGGIAVEMEAAGIMNRLPVAVIRGISDFADFTKNDAWQPYAAITAAAYAKEVLLRLPCDYKEPIKETSSSMFLPQGIRLAKALPESWVFNGRDDELAWLNRKLGYPSQQPFQKTVVALWGLTGAGKSQLASRFIQSQRHKHPMRNIFWISAMSGEIFEQSIMDMLKRGGDYASPEAGHPHHATQEQRMKLVDSFFAELNHIEDPRWLLVVDGIGESSNESLDSGKPFDIHKHVAKLQRGFVLLTSNRRDLIEMYHLKREIKGLMPQDAITMLESQIDRQLTEHGGSQELAMILKGSPLALRLAVSVISRYRYTVAQYVEEWTKKGPSCHFFGTDSTLSRSLEFSFQELEIFHPIAAKILTLFSFLDNRDLWYDLCMNAADEKYPSWLRELAGNRSSFENYYPILADLSFIELRTTTNDQRTWEIHPAIQAVARKRAITHEQEYIRWAVSLVAIHVPRSNEEGFWAKMQRLEPHANQCWNYIAQGKWGSNTNLTELESLGRLFRHLGRYDQAVLVYRMLRRALSLWDLSVSEKEFLSDVLTNLGLAYTGHRSFDLAFRSFQESYALRVELGSLTLDVSMSLKYNQALVFMMTGRLAEAEEYLRQAAAHFAQQTKTSNGSISEERKRLYIRILNDIGEVLLLQGSVADATAILSHILDSQTAKLGNLHPMVLSVRLNLGRAYIRLHEFHKARNLLEEVIAVYTGWWGRHHPDTMRAVDELAFAAVSEYEHIPWPSTQTSSNLMAAQQLWNECLTFYQAAYGDNSDITQRAKINVRHVQSLLTGDMSEEETASRDDSTCG